MGWATTARMGPITDRFARTTSAIQDTGTVPTEQVEGARNNFSLTTGTLMEIRPGTMAMGTMATTIRRVLSAIIPMDTEYPGIITVGEGKSDPNGVSIKRQFDGNHLNS